MAKVSLDPTVEQELINKAKKDKSFFAPLYEHYYKPILNFIKSKVESLETAEDLTSTVFQKALESIESFKWQGISFSSWLYRIARNTIIDYYRTSSKFKNNVSITDMDLPATQKNPEESAITMDFEDQISKLLETLPEKERKIIYMKFFEGYTNKTIAKLMEITETNVGTIIYRTIEKLRKEF